MPAPTTTWRCRLTPRSFSPGSVPCSGGRRPLEPEPAFATDDFTIDLASHRVIRANGDEVRLTPIEWNIVELLTAESGPPREP